jgi:hypothetical protein
MNRKNANRKGYGLATIGDSLMQVFLPENIDSLLVSLVGPTSN